MLALISAAGDIVDRRTEGLISSAAEIARHPRCGKKKQGEPSRHLDPCRAHSRARLGAADCPEQSAPMPAVPPAVDKRGGE